MPYPINQCAHQFNSIQSVPVSFGLWDTALKFLSPGPRSDVTDHLDWELLIILVRNKPQFTYSYFEKGCRKKCTRQSRKALWVVLDSLFFREI